MANEFLEDRLNALVNYGAGYQDEYNVDISETVDGSEYRHLRNPFPKRRFTADFTLGAAAVYANMLAMYHRCYGRFAGFRVKCADDYTTNAETGAPTAFDQVLALVSTGIYQLQKFYGGGGSQTSVGLPRRTIFKPVAGTVLVAIGQTAIRAADWAYSTVTGRITFVADVTTANAITGATAANPAVLTFATSHPFVNGQSVCCSAFAGSGWPAGVNGKRFIVSGVSGVNLTLTGLNATGFGAYTGSSGNLHTRPQAGEIVYGGCEFDIPVRFDTTVGVTQNEPNARDIQGVEMVELLNP